MYFDMTFKSNTKLNVSNGKSTHTHTHMFMHRLVDWVAGWLAALRFGQHVNFKNYLFGISFINLHYYLQHKHYNRNSNGTSLHAIHQSGPFFCVPFEASAWAGNIHTPIRTFSMKVFLSNIWTRFGCRRTCKSHHFDIIDDVGIHCGFAIDYSFHFAYFSAQFMNWVGKPNWIIRHQPIKSFHHDSKLMTMIFKFK